MAIKPGRSSKLEAMIGFDDCGGTTNSPMVGRNKRKGKRKDTRSTRFEDNYNNRSPATAPEMLVVIF